MIRIALKKSLLSGHGPIDLDVEFKVRTGELVALSGPSGSGKTTLLRILAGLLRPERGYIEVEGECWLDTGQNINWPTQKRNVGLVFQDYALFPHFNIRQNLRYALEKGQADDHLQDLISVMGLANLLDRKPETLSGGQRQRVALARALVRRPKLLLLDEPLSALDAEMRHRLQAYIMRVHRAFGLTTVLVSHDQREITRMADRILFIREGHISIETVDRQTPGVSTNASLGVIAKIVEVEQMLDAYYLQVSIGEQKFELYVPLSVGILDVGQDIQLEANNWQLKKL
ncbi:MAG: ABC transporter ATP-binding protein [Saprospiraceae bacterium]